MKIFSIQPDYSKQEQNPSNINFWSRCFKPKSLNIMGNVFVTPSYDRRFNEKIISLKDEIIKFMDDKISSLFRAQWEHDTNITPENQNQFLEALNNYKEVWEDEELYNKLKTLKRRFLKHLTKENVKLLDVILFKFSCHMKDIEQNKDIISLKCNVNNKGNSFAPVIDGQSVSYGEVLNIIKDNSDKVKVEQAKKEVYKKGDLLAEDIRNLVMARNKHAQNTGYLNYYDYILKREYGTESSMVRRLINQISIHLDDINYSDSQFSDLNLSTEQLIELVKNSYKKMGFNIDEYIESGRLTLDIFPRRNKSIMTGHYPVKPVNESKILANLKDSIKDVQDMFHEFGHSVMFLNMIPEKFYLGIPSYAFDEAIAVMMENLPFREKIVPFSYKDSVLRNLFRYLLRTEFEIKMYDNPNQDLKQLWHDLSVKYKYYDKDVPLNNEWATIPHYITHPGYYQNYLRASVMQSQLYNYLYSILGPISENPKTAEFMKKNIFKLYMSENENDLIKKITGKELSAEDLINDFIS